MDSPKSNTGSFSVSTETVPRVPARASGGWAEASSPKIIYFRPLLYARRDKNKI
jgi:hypothetical protein